MRVTILGSGSSGGVPVVGIGWGQCDPGEPKNRRRRPSILIEAGDKVLLVDTSPDLREQLLDAEVTHLDAVIYTHGHADHLHGIDDLRGINRAMEAPIDMYADAATEDIIRTRYPYILEPLRPEANGYYYKPTLNAHAIVAGEPFEAAGVRFQTVDQDHGYSRTVGLRYGAFGYSTDLMDMDDDGFEVMRGVHTWLVGVFTDKPHATHLDVDKAVAWVERVRPERAVFTHLGPDLDFATLRRSLPAGIDVAHDGMILEIPEI